MRNTTELLLSLTEDEKKSLVIDSLKLAEADLLLEADDSVEVLEAISKSDEDRIKEIVRSVLKSKPTEELLLKLMRNMQVSLYKALYTRRAFWKDALSLSNSD